MAIRFELLHTDGAARRGRLHTPHGVVETPVFMPVGTQATVKGLTPDQLEEAGARIILGNTYHLALRPGDELDRRAGRPASLHALGRPDPHRQRRLPGLQPRPDAQDHRPGRRLPLAHRRQPAGTDARTAVAIQENLGSDIAMCLDECPPPTRRRISARSRCGARSTGPNAAATPTAGPTRRCSPSCRAAPTWTCARAAPTRWRRSTSPATPWAASASARRRSRWSPPWRRRRPLLPADKPRYLMGVGRPQDILAAVARGIDMFDCVLPTRNGRNASAFTDDGPLRLRNACHKRDSAPLESDCPCYTCRHFSRAYLHHLFLAEGDARADAAVAAQRRLLLPADGRHARGDRRRAAWPSSAQSALPAGAVRFKMIASVRPGIIQTGVAAAALTRRAALPELFA